MSSNSGKKNRKIRFRTFLHNTIYDVMKQRGYKETDSDLDWDIHWADVRWIREVLDRVHLKDHQRVNHFRNHYELTRKDLLIKNVKRYIKDHPFEGCPLTYRLPAEYRLFVEAFKKHPGVYIAKPIGRAQGRGIFLFDDLKKISRWRNVGAENYIVQKYIENPYLIGGKKFDLRLYVLVTNYQPLTCYLYRSGFARFSAHKYSMKDLDNVFVHLTNHSLQKHSSKYSKDTGGCKWGIQEFRQLVMSKHGVAAAERMFSDMHDLIIHTLLSVQRVIINDKHCFELYGFDLLMDDNLKPWLLEVNASPSLTASTPDDYELKHNLLDDMMTILDLEKRLKGTEKNVGGFDLMCKGKPKFSGQTPCYLGAYNDRERSLKKLFYSNRSSKRSR